MQSELNYDEISSILNIPVRFRQLKHIESLMRLTESVHFFSKITSDHNSSEVHKKCCGIMSLEVYDENDIIINFGEIGDKFYIILKGSVQVLIPDKKIITISRKEFSSCQQLVESDSDESSDSSEDVDLIPIPKKKERRDGIAVASVSEIIKNLQNEKRESITEDNKAKKLIDEATQIKLLFLDMLKQQKKDLVKIVKDVDNEFIEIEVDKLEKVNQLNAGDSFGELALISDRPRAATVTALGRVSLLVIHKYQFRRILGGLANKRLMTKVKFLQSLPYFMSWTKSAITKISMYFNSIVLHRNQFMMTEGQEAKEIFFIKEGEFLITRSMKVESDSIYSRKMAKIPCFNHMNKHRYFVNKSLKICYKTNSESVGAYEVLNHMNLRVFSSICNSTTSEVYFILKEHFFSRIPHLELIKEIFDEENDRLEKRYHELYFNKSEDEDHPKKLACRTPAPKPLTSIQKFKKLIDSFDSTPKRHLSHSKNKTLKGRVFLRKLTKAEINRALNITKS